MLDDYFSLRFERQLGDVTNTSMEFETNSGIKIDSLNIVSIPSLIDGYIPQLEGLPRLISDLVNTINWDDELLCFSGICRALAEFFVIKEEYCSGESLSEGSNKTIGRSSRSV
uniref:Mlh1_C domain-containing protein n=1 Tax=Heterorhabditis bacteriophora TaxID=37862 RepID=A0A1I7XAP5_HETBA